ncbi:MAG: SAM-dependent methyltransferase [Gammaproteobacteria bacterium]
MGFWVDDIVPWGRSFDEYVAMFDLTEVDLAGRILGCGDGPAAFNVGLTARGGKAVSVDPVYAVSPDALRKRIESGFDTVLAQVRRQQDAYIWDAVPSLEALRDLRMSSMQAFLEDYVAGRAEGRYLAAELPELPMEADSFDLALSSHFLFLYADRLSADFHVAALREMLRVAREVRVFPLVTLEGELSPALGEATERLAEDGFTLQVRRVPYEFQRGACEMLRIVR